MCQGLRPSAHGSMCMGRVRLEDWRVGLEGRAPSSNKDVVAPGVPALTVKPTLPGQ